MDPSVQALKRKPNDERAVYLIRRCRTLRESAGKRVEDLARTADVDRGTIAKKIEKNHGVTAPTAYAVFNALNGWHGGRLSSEEEITDSPRKRK
jgi:transcriptional regulator with XRE-family HTH domain